MKIKTTTKLIALLIFMLAAPAHSQGTLSTELQAAVSSGVSFEKEYADPASVSLLALANGDPAVVLPELKQYLIAHPDPVSRIVVLDLVRESNLTHTDVVHHLLPQIDYTDPDDLEAASYIARRLTPIMLTGPDFSSYASHLWDGAGDVQIQAVIRWLMTISVFESIEDVSARMLAEPQQLQRHREITLAFHEIEDSAWRASRVYIPSDTMTPTASAALDAMLAAPEWWVRLAAVEVMKDYDYMATPARKAAACADTHPVVSAQAQPLCD